MKVSENFRMTVILCLMHLIVSTPHINQESHEYKKVDRKERQVFAVALGLAELFGSLLAPVAVGTAAVAGTAGVIAGAAAIKDKLDHGGSSGGGGSGGGSSGGQQTTALDRTIASVRAMSTTQVKTKLRTLVATATLPGNGGICMGVNMGYFGGGFHAGVCLPSCPTSEIAHCNVQVSSCLAGKCCLKDRIMGGYCVGYPTNRNATGIVGMCKPACSSQEVSATEICKSCGALLTKKCCIPKTPGAAAFLG